MTRSDDPQSPPAPSPAEARLIGNRLLLWLTLNTTAIGTFGYVLTVPAVDTLDLPPLMGVALCAAIVALLSFAMLKPLTDRLEAVDVALWRLAHNYLAAPLLPVNSDMLKPLVTQLNRLIEERATLLTMRGKLYEQISEAAAQEERKRLARDLHDSIKQQVFSMSISAAAAQAHLERDPAQARAALLDVRQSAQEAMVEMRALLQQLAPAPLEKSGLIDALREQAEAFAYRTGAQIVTSFGALPDDARFPIGAQETVFRIAQEALSNIARHARASHVKLSLLQTDDTTLTLCIRDDGQGFDPAQTSAGMGLSNIQARAEALKARVVINSATGNGTTLAVHLPLMTTAMVSAEGNNEMHKQAQSLFDNWVRWYRTAIIADLAFVITLPLMINNRFTRGDEMDVIDFILISALVVVFFGSFFYGLYSIYRVQGARSAFLTQAPDGSRLIHRMHRYTHLGYTVVALAALWFFPLLWIDQPVWSLLPSLTALVCFALVLLSYYRSYRAYDREMKLMTPDERHQEITVNVKGLQAGWGSLVGLAVVLALTDVFRNGIALIPQSNDEWMTTSMILIAVMLLFNQFIQLWYYRHQRRLLEETQTT